MGWIGFDLDGTLAEYHGWIDEETIGPPVPKMEDLLRDYLAHGEEVKIFTARASTETGKAAVGRWLDRNGFPPLEVTNIKDYQMSLLFDDRAVQVRKNTGEIVE